MPQNLSAEVMRSRANREKGKRIRRPKSFLVNSEQHVLQRVFATLFIDSAFALYLFSQKNGQPKIRIRIFFSRTHAGCPKVCHRAIKMSCRRHAFIWPKPGQPSIAFIDAPKTDDNVPKCAHNEAASMLFIPRTPPRK